jgi:hypothetical protein
MQQPRTGELASVTTLLQSVFPGPRFSTGYLRWLYEESPEGPYLATNLTQDGAVLGHYALVPQTWRCGTEVHRLALALNVAVGEKAPRKSLFGVFPRLAKATHETARQSGAETVIGVANASSTPACVGRLRFRLIVSLPVVVGMVLPSIRLGGRSFVVNRAWVATAEFAALAASIDDGPVDGYTQAWPTEKLAWRLSSPFTRYGLHVADSGILVSCATSVAGCRIVVALKFFRRKGAGVVDARHLLALAARCYRTPFFIYAGFNRHATVVGLPLPQRLRPSPLNLLCLPLLPSVPKQSDMRFETFEFLDFDAY